MASHRPGFARTNTERHENSADIELNDGGVGSSKSRGNYEFNDPGADVKAGATVDVSPRDDSPPGYEDGGDGFAKVTEPVESAKDLVTQVSIDGQNPQETHETPANPYTHGVGSPRRRRPDPESLHLQGLLLG